MATDGGEVEEIGNKVMLRKKDRKAPRRGEGGEGAWKLIDKTGLGQSEAWDFQGDHEVQSNTGVFVSARPLTK